MVDNTDDKIDMNTDAKSPALIFLDVDGVLNQNVGIVIHKSLINRLQIIVQETDAKIVLSSSWRKFPSHMFKLIFELAKFGIEIIDKTPDFNVWSRGHRGKEIEDWLTSNRYDIKATAFVILDDDKDVNETFPRNVVNTNPEIGLTDNDVKNAIKILNRKR